MNKLTIKQDIAPLVKLTLPLALTGLVQSSTWFFETIFLAQLGEKTLAAGSLVSWLFGTLAVILFGTLSSINILVALKHGAKDETGIALIARDGLLLSLMLSIPSTALLWNMAPIFGWFGQPQEVVELAQPYLHIVCWGLWANFVAMACLEVIIGVGRAKLILIFSFVTVALNLVWSYILIFGKFGFPALGIAGAGWGVTISNVGTLLVVIAYITVDKSQRNYFREVFALHKPVYLWELIQIGLPIGLMYCVEVAFFFALTLAMGVISIEVQAANQVALQYLSLVISIIFAMAQAITVRMGHLIGAKQYHQAERASYIGIGLGLIFISFVAVIYWVFPLLLISVDFDIHLAENASIIATIKRFLAICAVFQIAETLRISLFGALRSVKDTKFTLFTSFISFWLIAFPLGYLFAVRWQWGGIGYWWGMLIGASSSVIILQWRYRKKMGYLLNKN